jgi:NADH-quinone oxidoreductase subunit C/D
MMATAAATTEVEARLGDAVLATQPTADGVPTVWVAPDRLKQTLRLLKEELEQPYVMLHDLWAIDERDRLHREGQPPADFTVVYELASPDLETDLRLKVPLKGHAPSVDSITDLWPSANWYEREAWDLLGIRFIGHPQLRRLLMPPWWEGHPLRKEHPARATEMGRFEMPEATQAALSERLAFSPEEWGMERAGGDFDYLFLNFGPHHPGTHGVLRVVLQLDGQEVVDLVPDIGYHHRGAEKMAERQSWHTYIPYTDRVDYLGGAMNNLPYVMAVERLAGIEVPERAQVMRIMLCELYRINSHLVFLGTFAQDIGMMSPVFYLFNDRERVLDIAEAITGARMHPGWFRIGGVAQDLPEGWEELVRGFLSYLPGRLEEYEGALLANRIFRARTKGVGTISAREAIEWGATGPFLRACGVAWDLRKQRPYGGYERFEFEVPTGANGDCYDRVVVHVEEMRQSLRIVEQCLRDMPEGPYKADHPLTTPPPKERATQDIETLIHHFLSVSWGTVIPPGEASVCVEATKGHNRYHLISDGNTMPYRVRIRTPSFAHLQLLPRLTRGAMIPDLAAILGSIDYVLADVDR